MRMELQGPRNGDMIPVTVMAGDGPVIVLHTPEQYAAYCKGIDREAAEQLTWGKERDA